MRLPKLPLLLAAFAAIGLAACGSEDCSAGLTSCGGVCVNLQADVSNCGACGNACGSFAACGSGACVADSTLDVGPFGTDYASTQTRGFWFTAPVDFTITGLRVPTDVGTEVQNIEVVRFSAAPTIYPTFTNAFTSLGRYVNVAGTDFIPVNIPVASGDMIGILGARGTTTMHNSYGTSNTYATTIKGNAVTLARLGMQSVLNTTPAVDLFTEDYTVSRVEMYYR